MSTDDDPKKLAEEEGDDDKTPTEHPAALSGVAINLLDLASTANALSASLREAARQIDRAEGLARRQLCAQLHEQLSEICGDFLAASDALREEALRTG